MWTHVVCVSLLVGYVHHTRGSNNTAVLTAEEVDHEDKPSHKFLCQSSASPRTTKKETSMYSFSTIQKHGFLRNPYSRWAGGIVPYKLDPTFTEKQVEMILATMQIFNNNSCVQWVEYKNQKNYVTFSHDEEKSWAWSSYVGRKGGKQTIALGDLAFDAADGDFKGAILHEMMHVLGFIHQQITVDKKCYNRRLQEASAVHSNETVTNSTNKYRYVTEYPDKDIGFPYDFDTVMRYGMGRADEYQTMISGSAKGAMSNQSQGLSEMDKWKLNHLYCGGEEYCERHRQECARSWAAAQNCTLLA